MIIQLAIIAILVVVIFACVVFLAARKKRPRMLVRFSTGDAGTYNNIFDVHSDFVDVPLDRAHFEVIANLCREQPRYEMCLTSRNVAAILGDLADVSISAYHRKVMFRNIAQMCENDAFAESDNLQPEPGNMAYLELLRAMAEECGMDVRVSDDTATLTKWGNFDVNSGSTEEVCVVTKMKISMRCVAKIEQQMRWCTLAWFVKKIGIWEFEVASTTVHKNTVLGIAELAVTHLCMESCIVSLLPLLTNGTTIRKTLRSLNLTETHGIGREEAILMGQLSLETLKLRDCKIPSDSISAFHNAAITHTLREFEISGNELSEHDICTISEMQLDVLRMARCAFEKNALRVFGNSGSVVNQSLRLLDVESCALGIYDMKAIAQFRLRHLFVSQCGLEKGSLLTLVRPGSVVSGSLEYLSADQNNFGREDIVACAAVRLIGLDMRRCELNESDLVPLGDERSVAKDTLININLDNNSFGTSDVQALSKMRLTHLTIAECNLRCGDVSVLCGSDSKLTETLTLICVGFTELNDDDMRGISKLSNIHTLCLEKCGLHEGSLCILKGNPVLISSVCSLFVSQNTLGIDDFRVIGEMRLKSLDMSACLLRSDIADLLDSPSLKRSLKSLSLSRCTLSRRGLAAISRIPLRKLEIPHCSLDKGSLVAFSVNSSVIGKTLTHLVVTDNYLGLADIKVLAKMSLHTLKIDFCYLPGGSLVLLTNSVLSSTISVFHAWGNALDHRDHEAIITIAPSFIDGLLMEWLASTV